MKLSMLLLFFFCLSVEAGRKPVSPLDSNLRNSYIALLEKAADFHKIIETEQGEKALKKEIQETQEIIAKLYTQLSSVETLHHKIHSHKLLKSIEEQLILMRSSSLNKKAEIRNRKKLFNSFFELAQVYDLKKDIKNKIFYCPKDKSLWFQESGKAKNPISPHHKHCGRRVL